MNMRQSAGISVRDLQMILGFTVDEILVTDEDSPDDGEVTIKNSYISGISVQW